MRTPLVTLLILASLATALAPALLPAAGASEGLALSEYTIAPGAMCELRERWLDRIEAEHPAGTWAPLRMELEDEDLALLGLPPKAVLTSQRYPAPTMVDRDGVVGTVELPRDESGQFALEPLAAHAGAGCLGIRPGALLLTITNSVIGWCSMAHVYGSPGSYQISTAGHCGKVGETATVIAAFGNRAGVLNPVILDFGKYAKSTDGGLGNDWALIKIDGAYQGLVTPTTCYFGGPLGMYTKQGAPVTVTFPRNGLIPGVGVNPDPFLVQTIGHYGHGTGMGGPGVGSPRVSEAIHWGATHFMFFGAISPGDSGSFSNALAGDAVGTPNEAAGINTHLWVDPLMRDGLGIMGGTRATKVSATLALGQVVPYPAPVPGAP